MVLHAIEQEVFLKLQSRSATPTLFNDGSVDPSLSWSPYAIKQEIFLNQQNTPVILTLINNWSVNPGVP